MSEAYPPPAGLATGFRVLSSEPRLSPAGATECGHGWSDARRKAGRAQPVGAWAFNTPAPRGAEEAPTFRVRAKHAPYSSSE
jgi:hypothetical protein